MTSKSRRFSSSSSVAVAASTADRTFFVGGNWKSNCTKSSVKKLVKELNDAAKGQMGGLPPADQVEIVVGPEHIHLSMVLDSIDARYGVSAQNCWTTSGGAYTGEVRRWRWSNGGERERAGRERERKKRSRRILRRLLLRFFSSLLPSFSPESARAFARATGADSPSCRDLATRGERGMRRAEFGEREQERKREEEKEKEKEKERERRFQIERDEEARGRAPALSSLFSSLCAPIQMRQRVLCSLPFPPEPAVVAGAGGWQQGKREP
jgi:hypothetical protein